jgi:hypothetical protein
MVLVVRTPAQSTHTLTRGPGAHQSVSSGRPTSELGKRCILRVPRVVRGVTLVRELSQ